MTTSLFGACRGAVSLVLPLVAAAVLSSTAHAADANGSYAIRGAGTVTCSVYVSASPEQKLYAQTWWAGYLTAMNRVTPNTYNIMGTVSVKAAETWLLNYCQQNPTSRFETAVNMMLKAAYPNRSQSRQ